MTCCCAPFDGANCWGPIDPHHAGEGLACPDPEHRKTCDRTAIPICRGHHREIECFEGYFKLTWNKVRRRQFYDVEIVKARDEVARLQNKS
jgi:hypothetical protein